MARVDPEDDNIDRFVVQHYRYDPDRRKYSRFPVVAFDNEDEWNAAIDELRADLDMRRRAGEGIDPREGVTGMGYKAGDRDRNAYRRFLKRTFDHGVDVRPFLAEREAPDGLIFLFLDGDDDPAGGSEEPTNDTGEPTTPS